jgi:hypothetical protein
MHPVSEMQESPYKKPTPLTYLVSSAWKPLRGPVRDWPLALCDTSSVSELDDLVPMDNIFPQYPIENSQVYHRPDHKWYYLANQLSSELLIFRQADSQVGCHTGEHYLLVSGPSALAILTGGGL